MSEYLSSNGPIPSERLAGVREYIDGLPGDHAPPAGRLLLALEAGEPAGCVAMRALDASTCEMKRLYVRPPFRNRGLGRSLCLFLISEARGAGYARMFLDTGPGESDASALYESLGFEAIPPYPASHPGMATLGLVL